MRVIRYFSFVILEMAPQDLPDDPVINAVPLARAIPP
jgi:hypothetical protein